MRYDSQIRDWHGEGPLYPGILRRFDWPLEYDDDVQMIRTNVQEEGRGLYVLPLSASVGGKCVVEAYYPEDIHSQYAESGLDPYRRHDMGLGNLVVIHILFTLARELTWNHLAEIRRNNRAVSSDLKRVAPASYHKLDLMADHEAREAVIINRFADWYEEAIRDTIKFAMTPHSGPYRSSSLRQ